MLLGSAASREFSSGLAVNAIAAASRQSRYLIGGQVEDLLRNSAAFSSVLQPSYYIDEDLRYFPHTFSILSKDLDEVRMAMNE